jgi:hypothetical protein
MSIKSFAACILFLSTLWIGIDSYAGVFYCGSVEFSYDEKANVQYEDFPKGGGHTKIHESMLFQYGGKWPICLACSDANNSPIMMCGGQSSAFAQPFQFSKNEDGEWLQAAQSCNNRVVRPGDLTQETKTTTGAPPSKLKISAMLSVIGSDYTFMVAPAGNDIPQIAVSFNSQKKTTRRCGPPEDERDSHAFQIPLSIMFSETLPWVAGDNLSGVAPLQNEEGCKNSNSEFCKGIGAEGTVSYSLKSAGRWNLKRKVTDCTARVTSQTRGDIMLNGEPLPLEGEVPLARGDVITTGRHSRAEFKISKNAVLRVGADSEAKLNRDICKSKPTADMTKDLILGPASVLLIQILGSGSDFSIEAPSVAVGVRGELEPMNKTGWMPVSFSYAAESEESLNPEQITVPADWPAGGRAAYVKSHESGVVVVKALRGRVRVADADARRTLELKSGEIYRSSALARKNSVTVTMLVN